MVPDMVLIGWFYDRPKGDIAKPLAAGADLKFQPPTETREREYKTAFLNQARVRGREGCHEGFGGEKQLVSGCTAGAVNRSAATLK
jgi:hypothetical protein